MVLDPGKCHDIGAETISYRGPQKWNLVLERLRTLPTLNKFKIEIKKNESVMPAHAEYAKHIFNLLVSLTKIFNVLFSWT